MMGFLKKLFRAKMRDEINEETDNINEETDNMNEDSLKYTDNLKHTEAFKISDIPDFPQPFVYKTAWLVVKEADPKTVIKKLGCNEMVASNWESALACMDLENKVFVTPAFDGYVAILNAPDLIEEEDRLQHIAAQFEEVQFFSSMRIVDLYCWARYFNGEMNRRYCFIGESDEIRWNDGQLTKEEIELGFTKFPCNSGEDWDYEYTPDEENVIEIAAKWGLDPIFSKNQTEKSIGYLLDETYVR